MSDLPTGSQDTKSTSQKERKKLDEFDLFQINNFFASDIDAIKKVKKNPQNGTKYLQIEPYVW